MRNDSEEENKKIKFHHILLSYLNKHPQIWWREFFAFFWAESFETYFHCNEIFIPFSFSLFCALFFLPSFFPCDETYCWSMLEKKAQKEERFFFVLTALYLLLLSFAKCVHRFMKIILFNSWKLRWKNNML